METDQLFVEGGLGREPGFLRELGKPTCIEVALQPLPLFSDVRIAHEITRRDLAEHLKADL